MNDPTTRPPTEEEHRLMREHQVGAQDRLQVLSRAERERAAVAKAEGRKETGTCTHEAIEMPDDHDESGNKRQYPARVQCPTCGEKVTVSRWTP